MNVLAIRNSATRSSRFLRQSARKNNNCWLSTPSAKIYDNSVSRYSFPKDDDFDPSVRNLIIETKEKSKFIPNVMRVLARRPDEFNAFFNYYDVLMNSEKGSLTKAEKELIVVATRGLNQCLYCVVAHSALHRIFSKNAYVADQVAINPDMADLTDRERVIVNFAMDIAEMNEISEKDFIELEQHGLDREDAWNIGAIAAFFALSNRMAHLSAMKPNKEFYLLGRVPKDQMPSS